jgi:DNA-binding response OmpR family regulator
MRRILLVDDELNIRVLTRKLLEDAGYEVMEARDGKDILKILEKDRPDLILLDVMMPSPDGWEVCEKIKSNEKTKNIPVVMFTVKTTGEDKMKSRECGAQAHIDKPFDSGELVSIIKGVLEKMGSS